MRNVGADIFLFFAHRLIMVYTWTEICKHVFSCFQVQIKQDSYTKQEGHDGPRSLTWVSLKPNYFKICPPV